MTTTTKLVLSFVDSNGDSVSFSYNYADPEVTAANVSALMSGIITNGSIFQKVPATAKGAKLVTTETTEIALSA